MQKRHHCTNTDDLVDIVRLAAPLPAAETYRHVVVLETTCPIDRKNVKATSLREQATTLLKGFTRVPRPGASRFTCARRTSGGAAVELVLSPSDDAIT